MQRRPWENWGLLLGGGEPTDANVVIMPEAVYWSLPKEAFSLDAFDELTKEQCTFAWTVLGRKGPPPKMQLVLNTCAVADALKEVLDKEAEAKRPVVEVVQERLDSYRTNKQRKNRIKALKALMTDNDGYAHINWAIERYALEARLRLRRNVPAKDIEDMIYQGIKSGTLPVHANINGEHVLVPPPPPVD